jgi:hypothetical protein
MGWITVQPKKHWTVYLLAGENFPSEPPADEYDTRATSPNPDEASLQVHSQLQSSLLNAVHRVWTDRVSIKQYHIPDSGVRENNVVIA